MPYGPITCFLFLPHNTAAHFAYAMISVLVSTILKRQSFVEMCPLRLRGAMRNSSTFFKVTLHISLRSPTRFQRLKAAEIFTYGDLNQHNLIDPERIVGAASGVGTPGLVPAERSPFQCMGP